VLACYFGRKRSHHHPIDDDSQRPYVSWFAIVALSLGDLWSYVVGGAAIVVENVVLGRQKDAETEVNELHLKVLTDKDVFELQVAVDYLIGMTISDGLDELLHHILGDVLVDGLAALPLEVVAQRPVLKPLSDETNRMLSLYVLVKAQN
jgi:hypothetical protein